ncbi:hydroxyethylthiazole kinase [Texcoconibacillus texcoconensis]|uniref:Hydroxyethylthiazole kinase n=1 Tax=Texcoconibacillus texcoconensis TaxID=1095777 RepID=A0A840QQ52_9BACI|nr:hydroxyethylthiazole kinase [Texcoconibacillus texcoconensis]
MDSTTVVQLREHVRKKRPLIHHITNIVVSNFTANGVLSLGASPVMAYAIEEVEEIAQAADALVLNMGTMTSQSVEAMKLAASSAEKAGVPIVLDPVGVGASSYRTSVGKRIVEDFDTSVVRGNVAEIANLIGESTFIRGVDAPDDAKNKENLAIRAAKKLNTVIVVTGEEDIITDGEKVSRIENGDPMLTQVTGTGCLLTSVIAAFISTHPNSLEATTAAVAFYGIAAECAAESIKEDLKGPGHYQIALIDALHMTTNEEIEKRCSINT